MSGSIGLFSFGYTGTPIYSIEENVILFVCGNTLKFVDVKTNRTNQLVGAGRAVTSVAVNKNKNCIAYADNSLNPAVHSISYPGLHHITSLKGKAKKSTVI